MACGGGSYARDERTAEIALSKARKAASRIANLDFSFAPSFFQRLVCELKHVKGEARNAAWVLNCVKDAAFAAKHACVESLTKYYQEVESAEKG